MTSTAEIIFFLSFEYEPCMAVGEYFLRSNFHITFLVREIYREVMLKFEISAVILLVIFFLLFRFVKGWIKYVNALNHVPGPSFLTGLSLAWELGTTNRFSK